MINMRYARVLVYSFPSFFLFIILFWISFFLGPQESRRSVNLFISLVHLSLSFIFLTTISYNGAYWPVLTVLNTLCFVARSRSLPTTPAAATRVPRYTRPGRKFVLHHSTQYHEADADQYPLSNKVPTTNVLLLPWVFHLAITGL